MEGTRGVGLERAARVRRKARRGDGGPAGDWPGEGSRTSVHYTRMVLWVRIIRLLQGLGLCGLSLAWLQLAQRRG